MEKWPSERIKELADGFGYSTKPPGMEVLRVADWLYAIVKYLDEEHNRKQKEETKCQKE